VLRRNGPYNVVHIHGSSLSGLTCLLTARLFGVKPIIVHSHNDLEPLLEDSGPAYRLYCRVVAAFYRMIPDLGFACSERAARSLFGAQWRRDARFRLLYYGVDFAPFAAQRDMELRKQIGLPDHAFVIGHVGRFAEQKNHEFILDIAEAMVNRVPNAHFLLIGDGPLRAQITLQMERRGLRQHFTLVPDTMAVATYMRSAMDCFLLPSRYEGLGIVAVEAQAAGLPCLLSDRIPSEAVIDPSQVKVLSLDQPAEEWAHCLEELRNAAPVVNAAERMEMFLASRFNVHHCVDQLAETYQALAAAGQQRDLKSA
jgi:glycosyltransferase involved in cell wall biosynthesis